MITGSDPLPQSSKPSEQIMGATVRLAGDSGDGMQLLGTQLTNTSALSGNDFATYPDFPAEIRAPKGTRAGVSGFQVQFSAEEIFTPGDGVDALVAMNPAALVTNIADLKAGGTLIVNEESFGAKDLKLAALTSSPLDDPKLDAYRLIKVPMTKLTRAAVEETGISVKLADRCKNFFAMGLIFWLYGRDIKPTLRFIDEKFGGKAQISDANLNALKAGWYYGETTEAFANSYQVAPAKQPPGRYRNIMGNQAAAWGLIAAAKLSNKELFLGTYPITPASDILHELSKYKNYGVRTFQAEDEIAAICSTIGAAFGGAMAATTSSGPGIALKMEGLGLGVILELPFLIFNVQRGGPSTGLPTKTEQSDLVQAIYGRNGESPLPVIAAQSPGDCFHVVIEAWEVAVRLMTPVMILNDGYIANGSEPWLIPNVDELPEIKIEHPEAITDGSTFLPYERDDLLSRPWAIPGTEGLEHRIGGLEKEDGTGNVSYDADNHQHMINTRALKIQNVQKIVKPQTVAGPQQGDILVLSWGGTYGSCTTAVRKCQEKGLSVAHAHLRWLNPFPANLGEILGNFEQILIPELNSGQLRGLIQAQFVRECIGLNKMKGKPFAVHEIISKIESITSKSPVSP